MDSLNITIDPNTIKKISSNGYISYTMLMIEPDDKSNDFSNLVIQEKDGIKRIFTIRYKQNANLTKTKSSSNTPSSAYSYDDVSMQSGMNPHYLWEDDSDDGGGSGNGGSNGCEEYTTVCNTVNVWVETTCGCGHWGNDPCDGCNGVYAGWTINTQEECEDVCVAENYPDPPNDPPNDGWTSNGPGTSSTGDNTDPTNVATSPVNPDGSCPVGFVKDNEGNCVAITTFNVEALTDEQKDLFNEAVAKLSENCLGAALLAATNQVNVSMGATIGAGEYNPVSNTIEFMSNGDIFSDILGAELFHAYQQQLYGTLSDIYNGTKTSGGSNMEFEEKAFNIKKEIFDGGLFPMFPGEEKLVEWLTDLELSHPTGPITLSQSELDNWFDALEEFQQFHEENNPDLHYADPIDYNQNPNAILNLINRALEADCN